MKHIYQTPIVGIHLLDPSDLLTTSIPTTPELTDLDNRVSALDGFFTK